ncbi:MAG: prepilin-type N-terminal cleavage/methylation domain-containing protein [Sedimentisphaerales bacterium]|nr:prepilin-type N-terminal cleavage/methylation domain-containing protein [Sedimentisphaerales bacterium]
MKFKPKKSGFSLTEVLMAVGILSIGMMLIATMFPAAIFLTSVGTERTIASLVADEAFAKIQLFGIGTIPGTSDDYNNISSPALIDIDEYYYPSMEPGSTGRSQYCWSALCRTLSTAATGNKFQVTVFVSRKTSVNDRYMADIGSGVDISEPRPVRLTVHAKDSKCLPDELIIPAPGEGKYLNPPAAIVDDKTGKIYRVINRKDGGTVSIITIDREWEGSGGFETVWFISPPVSGGKNAGVEIFQAELTL